MDINTCYELTKDVRNIANYTHYVPILVSSFLAFYLLYKTKFSLVSRIFLYFSLSFNLWLIYDVVAWTSNNYYIIHTLWSLFDYTNVFFFSLGLYFFVVLINQKDIETPWKWFGFLLTLPPLFQVVTGNSIHGFNQPVCESINDDSILVVYKNALEVIVMVGIIFFGIRGFIKAKTPDVKKTIIAVGSAILLFFGVFAATDYLSSTTDYYEYGLYGLFVLPVFLGLIVYSIVKFKMFNVRLVSAQALVATLVVLVGSKLFTAESGTNQTITIVTLVAVCVFGYFLVKSVKKEIETRERIERLADDLESANLKLRELDREKSEFVSIASHQLRAPLTSIKGYLSMILEGDYGDVVGPLRETVEHIFQSANNLVTIVSDFLDVSRIEQGRMVYDWKDMDVKQVVENTVNEMREPAKKHGLVLNFSVESGVDYMTHGDAGKLKQVFTNIIDNSIKYTPKGEVEVSLTRPMPNTIHFAVIDTGIGIDKEALPKLFEKFTRADGANEVNVIGTGLGLYVAKEMIKAHEGGKLWAESKGKGHGSTFVVELKALGKAENIKNFAKDL